MSRQNVAPIPTQLKVLQLEERLEYELQRLDDTQHQLRLTAEMLLAMGEFAPTKIKGRAAKHYAEVMAYLVKQSRR